MSRAVRRRVLASLSIGVVLLLAIAILSFRSLSGLAEGVQLAAQSHDLLACLDRVLTDLADADTSQRSFAASGEAPFQASYEAAMGRLEQSLRGLQEQAAARPERRAQVEAIAALVGVKQTELRRAADISRGGDAAGALAVLTSPSSTAVTEDIRRRATELRDAEQAQVTQRSASARASVPWTTLAILGGSSLAFVLAALPPRRKLWPEEASPGPVRTFLPPSEPAPTDAPSAAAATEDLSAADRERRSVESSLARVFSTARDPILTFDERRRIMMMNRAAEQLLLCPLGEAIGAPLHRFIPEPLPAVDAAETRSLEETGVAGWRLGELEPLIAVRGDGQQIPIEATVTPVTVRGAQLYTAVIRDVSARVRMETQLREVNQRLEQALSDVQHTQEVMLRQERLKALGQLASGIAHDFNNALSMIVGFTEILLSESEELKDPQKLLAHLHLIHSAAQDAAGVVGRLREFSRPSSPSDDLPSMQVNDLIAQAISLTQPRWRDQAQAAGITIQVSSELGEVPLIAGRASELREALTNLIMNAVDAMPQGGALTLRSYLDGDFVAVEVADSGTGMPESVRDRIFDPFYTTKGDRGTGLGLPMVRGIVERHRGEIEVKTAPGQGTTFVIRLRPAEQPARAASPVAAGPADRARGLHVLLAEDEPSLRQILTSYLKIDAHTIEAAGNGHEALEKYSNGMYDLVITDRAMPGMGGDQLAGELQRRGGLAPVIMLTGLGDLMNEVGELPPGVDLVVAKPVTLAELRAAVSMVVTARGESGAVNA